MASTKWLGVKVDMQSAIGAAATITALTKASPGVASATNTFTNGDFVVLEVVGMSEVNSRVFRVAASSGSAFTLEGEDTTLFGTFTSGTAKKLTLGTSFSTLKTINGTGGEFDFLDVTTIHDLIKKEEPGLASPVKYDFDGFWDPSDTAQAAAIAASKLAAQRGVLFTFPGLQKMAFYGYIGASGVPQGSTGEKVTTKINMNASGVPTYYTT